MGTGKEAAVLFAELIGAAELYARAGDAAAHEAITRCVETLGQSAAASGARVVKRIGGRLMMLAENADAASRTAVALQVAAGSFDETGARGKLGLGIGFLHGSVIEANADVFGDTVNVAARLVEQAARGQILLDAHTAQGVNGLYRRSIRRLYSMQLKGLNEELALCEMVWRADEPATFYPFDATSEPGRAKLKLKYRGNKLVLRKTLEALTIGRDPADGAAPAGRARGAAPRRGPGAGKAQGCLRARVQQTAQDRGRSRSVQNCLQAARAEVGLSCFTKGLHQN